MKKAVVNAYATALTAHSSNLAVIAHQRLFLSAFPFLFLHNYWVRFPFTHMIAFLLKIGKPVCKTIQL